MPNIVITLSGGELLQKPYLSTEEQIEEVK